MSLERDHKEYNRKKNNEQLVNISLDRLKHEFKLEDGNLTDMIMTMDESFADYQKKYEASKEVVDPEVMPVGQSIITTATLMNALEQKKLLMGIELDMDLLEGFKESVSEMQIVVAVGPHAKEVKIGDRVKFRMGDFKRVINPNTVNSQEVFELPLEVINGRNYIEMHERNVKYIYKQKDK